MLKESLIENNSIKLNQTANTWEEAIKIGTDLLVDSGAIEPRYYEHIVNNIKKTWSLHRVRSGVCYATRTPRRRRN